MSAKQGLASYAMISLNQLNEEIQRFVINFRRFQENSTHENSTQRKFHPRKIPPNNRLKGIPNLTVN